MDKITFLVDRIETSTTEATAENGKDATVKMRAFEFQGKLTTIIENIARGISHVDTSNYNYEVDEASFFININEEGNLSVLSMVKQGIANGTGIKVTLKRKHN